MQSQDSPPTPAPLPAAFRGGRRAAEAALAAIDPQRYGASRNQLDGAVTRLSPAIRHGVLTLAEVRDAVFTWLEARGYGSPERRAEGQRLAGKLINELGWRDYWQRLWRQLGDGIWHDLEPLKTGHPAHHYSPELPADLAEARTGLTCIDGFSTELQQLGWLHNHARMWLASYLVHWRRVQWQAGAGWFLRHLLDADPASNNLSWQWVSSSFSNKPYIFNRANLERFSGGAICASCPAAARGTCPFEASYEQLQAQLFAAGPELAAPSPPRINAAPPPHNAPATGSAAPPQPRRPLLWIHSEALGPANPALRAFPGQQALLPLEPELVHNPNRRRFVEACAEELQLPHLPPATDAANLAELLLAAARRQNADAIVTSSPVNPQLQQIGAALDRQLPLISLAPEPFVELEGMVDLGRFSRYWRRAERAVWARWRPEDTPPPAPAVREPRNP